jgi:hypothetical protein
MTPEQKRRRDAKAKAQAEKIHADTMRAVAILLTDAWTLDELREHVVRRRWLTGLPHPAPCSAQAGGLGPVGLRRGYRLLRLGGR